MQSACSAAQLLRCSAAAAQLILPVDRGKAGGAHLVERGAVGVQQLQVNWLRRSQLWELPIHKRWKQLDTEDPLVTARPQAVVGRIYRRHYAVGLL
jgi:hypothetical protein